MVMMSGDGYVQCQIPSQVSCDSSLSSQQSYDCCLNKHIRRHQLMAAGNEAPMTLMMAKENPFEKSDALRSKKRKSSELWQSPWHKVVLKDSDMSQSISHSYSMLEQEWVMASNKLMVKNEEMIDGNKSIPPAKKRLILSTQLIQHLLPLASPPLTLSPLYHETVLYFVSRIVLGDACCRRYNIPIAQSDSDETISEKIETSKNDKDKDQQYARAGKVLVEKIQKLKRNFQRLNKVTSIVDIIVEIQELERFSVINRFAKFHRRVQQVNSSSSTLSMEKSVPQRYVTGLPSPKTVPEGLHCLPL